MGRTAQERDYKELSVDWLRMLAGPLVWAVYFFAGYGLAEFGCRAGWLAGQIGGLYAASVVIIGLTIAAAAGTAAAGWRTYQRWRTRQRHGSQAERWLMDGVGVMLSALFTFLIVMTGLPLLLLEPCR
jgi:hypothetical protein